MSITNKPGGWLTGRRLRAHAIILACCLWGLYVWTLATPGLRDRNHILKGTDFLHFYTLGSLALEHRGADLYDMNAQAALAAQRVPEASGIRYLPLYPPQVSILFAPLAWLSYGPALTLWWICSALIYGACCYFVWGACPNLRGQGATVSLLAIAYPAFFHLIAWGQTSALALVCFTAAFFMLRDEKHFLAGLILGCLIFKPQLGLAAVVIFVSIGAWKTVAGAMISSAAQLSVGISYYGLQPLRTWINQLGNMRALQSWLEPRPYQTHSLRTFWTMLVPSHQISFGLYVLSAIAVLSLAIMVWKRGASVPMALRYSLLLFATVLVAPHLTVYDLVILAPAILLLTDWVIRNSSIGRISNSTSCQLGTLLYLVYALPLVGPLSQYTHVQLSVVAMSASVYVIWQVSRSSDVALHEPTPKS